VLTVFILFLYGYIIDYHVMKCFRKELGCARWAILVNVGCTGFQLLNSPAPADANFPQSHPR
jgi:hypothetical protein